MIFNIFKRWRNCTVRSLLPLGKITSHRQTPFKRDDCFDFDKYLKEYLRSTSKGGIVNDESLAIANLVSPATLLKHLVKHLHKSFKNTDGFNNVVPTEIHVTYYDFTKVVFNFTSPAKRQQIISWKFYFDKKNSFKMQKQPLRDILQNSSSTIFVKNSWKFPVT